MKSHHILLFIRLLCFIMAADDASKGMPKSPAALSAVKKYGMALDRARSDYDRAMQSAEKQLIAELDVAEKVATKAGSLDEALAIRAAKVDSQSRFDSVQTSKPANDKSHLAKDIIGTVWRHSLSGTTLEYHKDGVLTAEGWKQPGRWEAVDENTVVQTESTLMNVQVRVTFSGDRKASLWQYITLKGHDSDRVAIATLVSK